MDESDIIPDESMLLGDSRGPHSALSWGSGEPLSLLVLPILEGGGGGTKFGGPPSCLVGIAGSGECGPLTSICGGGGGGGGGGGCDGGFMMGAVVVASGPLLIRVAATKEGSFRWLPLGALRIGFGFTGGGGPRQDL